MPDYTMAQAGLQVCNPTKSTGNFKVYVDGDEGTVEVVEVLQDEKFGWKDRKRKTLTLADAYRHGRMDKYADRALSCATWLEYLASADGSKRQLRHYNACKMRLCPLCAARRAKIMARRLMRILDRVRQDHDGIQLIFLTLTMQNVTGDKLRHALDELTAAWSKLRRRRPFDRAVKGWFRAIEITRNRSQDTYHPHIHAILVVEDGYFVRSNGLYLTQNTWVTMWKESLQVSYRPIVDIRSTYVKGGKNATGSQDVAKAASAALEAAKYATKDEEYINRALPLAEAAAVASVYTFALRRKRMTAMGGWLKDAAVALDLDVEDDSNLVSSDDGGELTELTAELLESYGWHFGLAEHVLVERKPNPAYGGGFGDDGE